MPNVSLFGNIYDTSPKDDVDIEAYLQEVKDGRWEDIVHNIRRQPNEKQKDALKRGTERVTFSGIFSKREDTGLLLHSGILAIDLDDLEDPEAVKKLLSEDRYVYSCFRSAGGNGLTSLFKIQSAKHREAFFGIADYLLENYGLVVDPQSIVLSKPIGITFDPNIYISQRSVPLFTKYIKEKKVEKIQNFAFAEDDFNNILKQISERNIIICETYDEYLKVGFAFADKFGESGRGYYHLISGIYAEKYNKVKCDKQYDYCLKSKKLNIATISTFYYFCKQKGIQITSERTAKVRKATLNSKSAGLKKEQIIENLKKFEGIEDVDKLVSDIYDSGTTITEGDGIIEQLEIFVSSNYSLERNVIKRFLETNGKQISQVDLNSMYLSAKKIIPNCTYDLFERLLMSDFIKNYNPLLRFLESLPEVEVIKDGDFISPNIDKISASIINDIQPFTEYFLRKWIVSFIAAAHGEHSPLMLVLSGEIQGTGKTDFFRRLLPNKMFEYYAESKLDAGKDDEILMTQKWLIMDDEMSGKSKKESQRLKELTSKQFFSLREPYGRINVDLMRIAVLAGTSNEKGLLHDTSNRRQIIIPVDSMIHERYNSVDKTDLFAEAYWLWKKGFDWKIISKDDIDYLKTYENEFEAVTAEKELIAKYFTRSKANEYLTSSEIKVDLEILTHQRLSLDMIGRKMTKMAFEKKSISKDGQSTKRWHVRRINRFQDNQEENPF